MEMKKEYYHHVLEYENLQKSKQILR